tara:strand:- start:63 stop:665 length:603 start_codon:yes stop_codon:yes gene_type:complete
MNINADPSKIILTDCDGVVLDWEYAFDCWMIQKGYSVIATDQYDMDIKYGVPRAEMKKMVRYFNESAWVGKMTPLRDAVKYVKKLHEEFGYVFHAITSLSNDPYAQELRTQNLKNIFGEGVFEKFIYLDTGADKDDALAPYAESGCYWVEDKPENAMLGYRLGLEAILIDHDHNQDMAEECTRVACWRDIYELAAIRWDW